MKKKLRFVLCVGLVLTFSTLGGSGVLGNLETALLCCGPADPPILCPPTCNPDLR